MPSRNHLLSNLPRQQLKALADDLKPVRLELRQPVHEPDRAITRVCFPVSGIVSVVNEPNPGEVVEIATVGREGMVGVPVILGVDKMPSRAFVQVPGEGFEMRAKTFRRLMDRNARFRALMMRYVLAFVTQVAQSTSCNRLHEVQERCARWLLQTHDRVDGDSFLLTHEFLGQMLGVHRPTVSVAAGMLQKAGLIRYTRGVVTVLDRKGLERASCNCYGFITREYDRLLNGKG
jgi:CRP-like cAMP-binding protein